MMRVAVLCVLAAVATAAPQEPAQEATQETQAAGEDLRHLIHTRVIKADVLRDFQGVCFSYVRINFYPPGMTWALAPFCGVATCIQNEEGFFEEVHDCGPEVKNTDVCKLTTPPRVDLPFPQCCPRYECPTGVEKEYFTDEEIVERNRQKAAAAEQAALAEAQQAAAAAAQQAAEAAGQQSA